MFDKEIEAIEDTKAKKKLEELKIVADKIIGFMGLSDKLKTELYANEYCDPELRIGNDGCSIVNWKVIRKTIVGTELANGFCGGHMVIYPGARYYKDGSGEPDCEDFVEDFAVTNINTAAEKGIELALKLSLSFAVQAHNEEQTFKDFEEDKF